MVCAKGTVMTMRMLTGNSYLRWLTHPVTAAIAGLGFFVFVRYMDTRWAYMPFVFAVTLALAAVIFLVSRRPYFSLYAAGIFSVLQALASLVKFKLNGMALHIYDVIFTSGDSSLISFLVEFYTPVLVAAAIALVGAIGVLTLVFRVERPVRFNASMRVGLVPVALALCFTAFPRAKTHDSEYLPFTGGYNASALYFSLAHLRYLVARPPITARLDTAKAVEPFADTVNCGAESDRADIIVSLAESQVPPSVFPDLSMPAAVNKLFRSGDGGVRSLHVETFGAGTWMTNFSVLTGLSTADFGWQAPYVNNVMEGKIHGALPEMLSRCGYRTIAMMALKYHSVNEGPFLKSLGFDEVYDADAMAMGIHGVHDASYFGFVDKLIAQHRKTDKRPLFIALQTMFSHGPYNQALVPERELPAEAFSADPETNEYLRRVMISRLDFSDFLKTRSKDPGPHGIVIAEFGDHQATATKHFVEEKNLGSIEQTDFTSEMYRTFYAVHAFGRPFDYTKAAKTEDAAFMMARILDAGGLPTSPVYVDLVHLSDICGGRFHLCSERAEIDRHLERRIEAGLLKVE